MGVIQQYQASNGCVGGTPHACTCLADYLAPVVSYSHPAIIIHAHGMHLQAHHCIHSIINAVSNFIHMTSNPRCQSSIPRSLRQCLSPKAGWRSGHAGHLPWEMAISQTCLKLEYCLMLEHYLTLHIAATWNINSEQYLYCL